MAKTDRKVAPSVTISREMSKVIKAEDIAIEAIEHNFTIFDKALSAVRSKFATSEMDDARKGQYLTAVQELEVALQIVRKDLKTRGFQKPAAQGYRLSGAQFRDKPIRALDKPSEASGSDAS